MSPRKENSPFPIFLLIGGGLLLVFATFLLANQTASSAATPVTSSQEETYSEIPRVSLDEAKTALEAGTAVVVDVRSTEAYAGGHIAGAINIPLANLESRLNELDKAQWIITYCT